jgi:SAM-dependent MidA family methyltransferase
MAGDGGMMDFAQFMQLALYDEQVGYYRQAKARVGFGGDTDFYTASTSGAVFGELIATAARQLLDPETAAQTTFVEIGAEPGGGILNGVEHGFADTKTIRVGDITEIAGRCVVFSNELFDAQPFRRFVFRDGHWLEMGVRFQDGKFHEMEVRADPRPDFLPAMAQEGYRFDAPCASVTLLRELCQQPWHGLFIAADYGKSFEELVHYTPRGTARSYFRHNQTNALLDRPGEQDITCHICWDWLVDTLLECGFELPQLESQEAFLIHHASNVLETIATSDAAQLSRRKQSIMQLLHPGNLGQKFQVLHSHRICR